MPPEDSAPPELSPEGGEPCGPEDEGLEEPDGIGLPGMLGELGAPDEVGELGPEAPPLVGIEGPEAPPEDCGCGN